MLTVSTPPPPPIEAAPLAPATLSEGPLLPRRQRVAMLVGPLLALVVAYFVAWAVTDHGKAGQMAAAALASFLGLGTTVIFGSAVLGESSFVRLTTLELAIVVLVLNTALAVVFVGSFDLLEKLPGVGPKLSGARGAARRAAADRPWIRRFATAGVAFFVLSPLPGSGALGGTLVGRIVGLSRVRTFVSVAVANAAVCGAYALGADALEQWMHRSRMTTGQRIGLVLATAVVLLALVKWVVSRTARPTSPPAPEEGRAPPP